MRKGMMGWVLAVLFLVLLPACEREKRPIRVEPSEAVRRSSKRLSGLQPGARSPEPQTQVTYEHNAYALYQGKKLYEAFNCAGCHGNGGGNIGPALMDDQWIYGSSATHIYATIIEGRPNGMPSFRGRIAEFQVWQIVAYVRSMSGQVPFTAATNRNDNMHAGQPESSRTPRESRSK